MWWSRFWWRRTRCQSFIRIPQNEGGEAKSPLSVSTVILLLLSKWKKANNLNAGHSLHLLWPPLTWMFKTSSWKTTNEGSKRKIYTDTFPMLRNKLNSMLWYVCVLFVCLLFLSGTLSWAREKSISKPALLDLFVLCHAVSSSSLGLAN